MNRINQNNYEAFLLDYLEGNLSPELQDELFLFVASNPELNIQLNDTELPVLESDSTADSVFSAKNKLYKSPLHIKSRFEELCCLWIDGLATEDHQNEIKYLQNQFPELIKDFNAFLHTKLKPDYSIQLGNPELLKKHHRISGEFDDLAVKFIEKSISPEEEKELNERILNNPALIKSLNYFKASLLKPDLTIKFNLKESLYRKEKQSGIIVLYGRQLAAAASLLLLAGLFTIFNFPGSNPQTAIKISNPTIQTTAIRKALVKNKTNFNNSSQTESSAMPNKPFNGNAESSAGLNEKLITPTKIHPSPEIELLQAMKAVPIRSFELPSDYLSWSPAELQKMNDLNNTAFARNSAGSDSYLSPGQFARKKITKLFKKQNIDIATPLEKMNNQSLSDLGMKGLEKVSRGKIYLEKDEDAGKITTLHFFGLTYSRN